MSDRDLAKLSGLALGTVNAVKNEVGGSAESLQVLDETVRRHCAKVLRFAADMMEGIA